MSSDKTVVAFDAYGTLLSTASIAEKLAAHFGEEKAKAVATEWRRQQLEYTWRLNSMKQYQPFSVVTRNSLLHTLKTLSLSLPDSDIESLMKAYDTLSIFPDVAPGLRTLSEISSIYPVVFSNGTQTMISTSVYKSPDLGPYSQVFKDIVVVDDMPGDTKAFKPAPEVYHHLAKTVGKGKGEKEMGSMWLVSSNPFDVAGARAVGMKACWVDREGKGWSDGLVQGDVGQPSVVVKGIDDVAEAIKEFVK